MPRSHFRDSRNIIKTLAGRDAEQDSVIQIDKHRDKALPVWLNIGDTGQPAFQNGWVNYSNGSDGNPNAGFWRSKSGIVYLRGLCKSGAVGTIIFTLPVGFRPGIFAGVTTHYRFAVNSSNLFGAVRVTSIGDVFIDVASTTWIDLAGIQFRAEN